MVEYAIIALAALSIVLLIISFFAKDELKPLEEQIDQLTVSLAQETYQMKKRLQVIEEELLIPERRRPASPRRGGALSPTDRRVLFLHKQGFPLDEIAQETGLTVPEVERAIRRLQR
ncbi:sigma-70 region 4 type 2 [Geobacillus genomosp. 3]|uniref:Sigma-70 region 4 type 2 n=1 Tax=Geobacillus genomosp. 3 TaxID=1921421 RepID=S5Z7K4_GEOG3|nr:sigma factor-like helix-turn-helix DNA-binding protein [Geobacillus genomosp. 3]AGT32792.1 sigma-70 region 4 type 2 [Geobacillus genomosp. 3]